MTMDNAKKHPVFNRSFDVESCFSKQTKVPRETGPSRSRCKVRYVNERREFDPFFQNQFHCVGEAHDSVSGICAGFQHPTNSQLLVESEVDGSADKESLSCESKRTPLTVPEDANIANLLPSANRDNLAVRYTERKTQDLVALDSKPLTEELFHEGCLRRGCPLDESINSLRGSTSGMDSVGVVLDSCTAESETAGDASLAAVKVPPTFGFDGFPCSKLAPSLLLCNNCSDRCSEKGARIARQGQSLHLGLGLRSGSLSSRDLRERESASENAADFEKPNLPKTRAVAAECIEKSKHGASFTPITTETFATSSDLFRRSVQSPLHQTGTGDTSIPGLGTSSMLSMMAPQDAPSCASSSAYPSEKIASETGRLVQNLKISRYKSGTTGHPSIPEKARDPVSDTGSDCSTTEDTHTLFLEEKNLALHDRCGEPSSTEDISWRKALSTLSMYPHLATVVDAAGWTPLHVACLGSTPPPLFMTRSLLYVYRGAARRVDKGGRLPLHLVAASSGDTKTMELLVQEYPQAVYQTDAGGWTPLQLILKNFTVDVTVDHSKLLLGLSVATVTEKISPRISQRRGNHLSQLDGLLAKKSLVAQMSQRDIHEKAFALFPMDVQAPLRRLCHWKRRLARQETDGGSKDSFELEIAHYERTDTNPAARCTPVNQQLPLHLVVRRGLYDFEDKRRKIFKVVGEGTSTRRAIRKFLDIARLFIALYPEGLITRDIHGHTPLMTALTMSRAQPSLELIKLLLGNRTPGSASVPSGDHNIPLYHLMCDRYLSSAMIPCNQNRQLPLHVAAEEMPLNLPMLASIFECYPGAIQVQDCRGRTPLHTLLRNYRRYPLDPSAIALLLSDNVARTVDDEGKVPFDLLTQNGRYVSLEQPRPRNIDESVAVDVLAFKKFFHGFVISSEKPGARKRLGSESFLWRLRSLPPWLRQQACSTAFVQELVVEELASPAKCAFIFLYATFLGALVVIFPTQIIGYFVEDQQSPILKWTSFVVYLSTFGLSVFQLIFWFLCIYMSEFMRLCALNMWRWVDVFALLLVTATTTMVNHLTVSEDTIFATGAVALFLLWFSFVGFFSSWWYGAAVLSASIEKVVKLMFLPFVIILVSVLGFAQILHMITDFDFTLPDCWALAYMLIVGEPVADNESNTRIVRSLVVLVIFSTLFMFLLALGISVMVILAGSERDHDELALTSFWEPKLAFVIFACGHRVVFTEMLKPLCAETVWGVATNILCGRYPPEETHWYTSFSRKPAAVKACYWVVLAAALPLWILFGLCSFGILWPPQVRRFLFRPAVWCVPKFRRRPSEASLAEANVLLVSGMRDELLQLRGMSYEQSVDFLRELSELKNILRLALDD